MQIIEPPDGVALAVSDLPPQLGIEALEHAFIELLIASAAALVETATNRLIAERIVEISLPEGDWTEFWLPFAPVQFIASGEGLTLVEGFNEPRLLRGSSEARTVQLVVGHEDPLHAPLQLRQAIMLQVIEWREAGISVGEAYTAPRLSFGVERLIKQVRYLRPQVVR